MDRTDPVIGSWILIHCRLVLESESSPQLCSQMDEGITQNNRMDATRQIQASKIWYTYFSGNP